MRLNCITYKGTSQKPKCYNCSVNDKYTIKCTNTRKFHLAWRYAWIFVRWQYLFLAANSLLFKAKFKGNYEPQGTDNVQVQMSMHLLCYPSKFFAESVCIKILDNLTTGHFSVLWHCFSCSKNKILILLSVQVFR